jgi:hypothetical protein
MSGKKIAILGSGAVGDAPQLRLFEIWILGGARQP